MKDKTVRIVELSHEAAKLLCSYYHVMSSGSNHATLEEAVEARNKCHNPHSDILLYEPDGKGGMTYKKIG